MNSLVQHLPFLLFAFVASITPGPTNILILANGQIYGVRATLPAVAGACVAASAIVFASGFGAGELLGRHAFISHVMAWSGALWLSWLSWKLFWAPAAQIDVQTKKPFGAGAAAALQFVNPKTWMMALAVGGLFVPYGQRPLYEASLLSLYFFVISLACLSVWAVLGKVSNVIFRSPSSMRYFQRVMALCLLISSWSAFIR